jgi:preprotein translocase subunit SecG
MQVWYNVCVMLQIVAAVVMIGLVLIQHGKGADMGASFGSGASGSLFGATGSANFLSRSTAVCATVFFAATLALSVLATHREAPAAAAVNTSSRLDAALGAPAAPSAASAAQAAAPASANATASAAASGSAPAIPTK